MLRKNKWDTLHNPKAWVPKALLHIYRDQQKRQGRGRELEIRNHLTPGSCLDDGLNVWEDRQWVAQMLRSLSPAQRAVVELIIDGLRPREIAYLLGKTPETIRQHLAEARKKLEANLGPDYRIGPAASPTPVRRKEGHPVSIDDDTIPTPDGSQPETVGEAFAEYLGLVEETIRTQVTDDDIEARVRRAMDRAASRDRQPRRLGGRRGLLEELLAMMDDPLRGPVVLAGPGRHGQDNDGRRPGRARPGAG